MTEPLQDLAALLRAGVLTRVTATYHSGHYTDGIEDAARRCVQKAEPQ